LRAGHNHRHHRCWDDLRNNYRRIDLSVGSVLAFAGVVMASALHQGVPLPLALLVGLGIGLLCGLVNGLLITVGRLPPFIATLGMMSVARGTALMFTEGRPVSGFSEGFRSLATGEVLRVPTPVVIMIVVYAIAYFVLRVPNWAVILMLLVAMKKLRCCRASTSSCTRRWCTVWLECSAVSQQFC